jgi:hypothetical protein
VLFNFQTVEKLFYVGIGAFSGHRDFGGAEQCEKSFEFIDSLFGVVVASGERFGPKMYGSEIADGSYDDRRLRKQK